MENVKEATNTKPRQTIIGNIFETYNYELFKTLIGNRDINTNNVKKLIKKMKHRYLLSPIIVNPKMEIIDGQHRFEAAKSLALPIHYIIDKNGDLEAVQIHNSIQKNWNNDDHLNSCIELGIEEYKIYKHFKEKYSLPHSVCIKIFGNKHEDFKEKNLTIKNLDRASKIAELAYECKDYHKNWNSYRFISALAQIIKIKGFNAKTLVHKIKTQRNKIYHCANIDQYVALLEEIYNYRNRSKLNFRI